MMLSLILTLHITGSIIFIGYVLVAIGSLVLGHGDTQLMRHSAFIIGVHQVITGLLLGLLSPNMTMLAVCFRGIALVAVLVVLSYAVTQRLSALPAKS